MNALNSIKPKWGITRYQQRGCKSFEFHNPKMRVFLPRNKPFPPRVWRNIAKNLKKINPIPCYHCVHYHSTRCTFSHTFIHEMELEYQKKKPRCIYCNTKVQNFHEFLLKCQDTPFICTKCETYKKKGTLVEELNKDLKLGFFDNAKIVMYLAFIFLPIIKALHQWITKGIPDYFSAIFGGVLFLVVLGIEFYSRKEKNRKRNVIHDLMQKDKEEE